MDSQHLSLREPEREPCKPVPQNMRYRYGCPSMEILATNQSIETCLYNPALSTFSIPKIVFTTRNSEFEKIYSANIHPAIVKLLLCSAIPTNCRWTLQVLRLGFEVCQTDNPIVVHLLVEQGYLSDDVACGFVDEISAVISAAWQGEKIYVDICQDGGELKAQQRAAEDSYGVDLSKTFSEFYEYDDPCPGFSVGPEDAPRCAGSVTGLIKHGNNTYVLTCDHVLNSAKKVLGLGSYKYKDGEKKFMVTIPAACDHNATQEGLLEKRKSLSLSISDFDEQLKRGQINSTVHQQGVDSYSFLLTYWDKAFKGANDRNIRIGHVYATSGQDRTGKFHYGNLDWGIFQASKNAHNKHPRYTGFDDGSGLQLSLRDKKNFTKPELTIGDMVDTVTKLDNKDFERAQKHFRMGPAFKPLQEGSLIVDNVYFKPPSRSLSWKVCSYNGIKSTQKNEKDELTREDCFVGSGLGRAVSTGGDSGAPLLDLDFRPIAMLWGGHLGLNGFEDVTFATPLTVVLRDIERRMGWEVGSVSYC